MNAAAVLSVNHIIKTAPVPCEYRSRSLVPLGLDDLLL